MNAATRTALALATGAALGAAMAVWLAPGPPAPVAPGSDAAAARVDALEAELERERAARLALSDEVSRLRARFEAEARLEPAPRPQQADAEPEPDPEPEPKSVGFDEAALRGAGVDEREVARLREIYEAQQLAELYLHHRAEREGWARTVRYRRELAALRDAARAELGDEDYDRILYASGRNNRVAIAEVLDGSPAERAGLRRGDVLLSYGGERVFDGVGLRDATAAGTAGTQTEVRVLRGDEVRRFFAPRGPLGVQLQLTRRAPEAR